MHVLEARQARKVYGEEDVPVEAVRGVDLAVSPGTLVAIVGPSGSGKSTLLYMLGAIELPTSGSICIEGVDLATLDDDRRTLLRRQRIGFIFQSFNLMPTLTAQENVALPLRLDGIGRNEALRRAAEILESVDLAHRLQHLPSAMSGGEQQRVAIARALVIRPALLLADEPTGNLDSANGKRVTQTLRKLVDEQHQTIVLVTHDSHVAEAADRVIHLRDGHIEREEDRLAATRRGH